MFCTELSLSGHVRRFLVSSLRDEGWEVRIEHDAAVVRRNVYNDWHRVERVRRSIVGELDALRAEGWRDVN